MSCADVNGSVHLYYEEHGPSSGQPLILVHGGLGSGEMYPPILPTLAGGRRVITVDLQAHAVIPFLDAPSLEPPPPVGP
jgi:pimeloyl-ACP methyl ester carboxylesterase